VNPTNRKLAGYDIPAGYTLTADPRIPFKDEALFPDVDAFKPERFISGSPESQRNVVTGDTYFPGGMGQHQCPGISLAVVMTQIFLAEFSAAIDSWTPTSTPTYVQIPIVILADECTLQLSRASR
jgi:cytochrome P450